MYGTCLQSVDFVCIKIFAALTCLLCKTVLFISVREYVFYLFFKIQKACFYFLLQWNVKKRRKRCQSFRM